MSKSLIIIQDLADKIEPILDTTTMDSFLNALALVCSEKADHIRTNWQDERTAQAWDRYASEILKSESRIFRIEKSL